MHLIFHSSLGWGGPPSSYTTGRRPLVAWLYRTTGDTIYSTPKTGVMGTDELSTRAPTEGEYLHRVHTARYFFVGSTPGTS